MTNWTEIYETPRQLTAQWGHRRIYAPQAYATVRGLQLVPIGHAEALTLAAYFPICWHVRDGDPVLCVLRSLLGDGRGSPLKPGHSAALPLVLRGFPVMASPPGGSGDEVWIDDVVADQPTDIGAPILMPDGRLSRGAALRVQAIMALRRTMDTTRRLSDALMTRGLLEPWPLAFELSRDAEVTRVDHLQVVRPMASPESALAKVLAEFGVEAAVFLTAHRISLFRISVLVQAARQAVAPDAPGPALQETA